MDTTQLQALFEKHEDEYCKFNRVENKWTRRPDLHAFILIDKILAHSEEQYDIISGAEHDEIFLSADMDELARLITEEQVIELIRCGVRYTEFDTLGMFV